MTKMMVQNLSSRTTVESLNRLFSEFGAVISVSLATDIMTGPCITVPLSYEAITVPNRHGYGFSHKVVH